MSTKHEMPLSPTSEIMALRTANVPEYISRKRRNMELGDVIGRLNYELMFGPKDKRHTASAALEKLGFALD